MSKRQGEICEYTDIGKLLSKKYYDENSKLTKSELYDDKQNVVYTLDLSNNEDKEIIDHPLITMTRINGEIIGNYKVSEIKINGNSKNYYLIFNQKNNDKYFYDIVLELINLTSKSKYEITAQFYIKENKLDGEYKIFQNGKLVEHCYFKEGKLDGEYTEYKDDKIIIKCSYKDGKCDGDYKIYDNTILVEHKHYQTIGKLDDVDEIKQFKDGKLIKHYYRKKGYFTKNKCLIERYTYYYGKFNGEYTEYNDDERIFKQCNYDNGILNGKHIVYCENIIKQSNYVDGKLNGEYTERDDNKKLIKQCNYINDKLNGEYSQYDDNGNLIKHCKYIDGKIVVDYLADKKKENHNDEDSIEDKNKKQKFKFF